MAPLSEKLFDDKKKRDRTLSLFKELDQKGGLDDLGRVINSLSETNFYDSLYYLFECVEKPGQEICKDRKVQDLTRDDLINFFRFFNFRSDEYKAYGFLLNSFLKSIEGEEEELRSLVNLFYKKPEFVELRLEVMDRLSEEILKNFNDLDRVFFQRFLTSYTKDGEKPWIEDFIKKKLDYHLFFGLISYSFVKRPQLINDMKAITYIIDNGISCNSFDNGSRADINVSTHLDQFIEKVTNSSQKEFFQFSIETINTMHAGAVFCPKLKKLKTRVPLYPSSDGGWGTYEVDLPALLSTVSEFLLVSEYFDFVRFLQVLTTKDLDPEVADPKHLIRFLSGDFFHSVNDMNRFVSIHSPEFYKFLYKILESLDTAAYVKSGSLLSSAFKRENENFMAFGKIWQFFTTEEKNFLFNYIDRHLDKDANYSLLFKFYSSLLIEVSDELPLIMGQLLNEENIDKTLDSLKLMVRKLKGEEVRGDFLGFFSRDHMLKIVEIISQGATIQEASLDEVGRELNMSDIQGDLQKDPLIVALPQSQWVLGEEALWCIKDLDGSNIGLHDLLWDLPDSCEDLKEFEFSLQILSHLADFQVAYSNESIVEGARLFDDIGLFSNNLFNTNVFLLKFLDDNYDPSGEGLKTLLSELKGYFYDKEDQIPKKELINNFVKLLTEISGGSSTAGEKLRSKAFHSLAQGKNYNQIGPFLGNLENLLLAYSKWESSESYTLLQNSRPKVQSEEFKCENFLNQKIGGSVCPNMKDLNIVIDRIMRDLLVQYDKEIPSAAGQLLRAISVESGLKIPFDREEQKAKRITLKESLDSFKNMMDGEKATNQLDIKYYLNTSADRDYFEKSGNPYPEVKEIDDKARNYKYERMKTLERIEVVIRDVRFDNNYLGAHYMNSVAKSENYNKTVKSKRGLMKTCVPLRFCAKFMNKAQGRFAKNAIATFDSLLDLNTKEGWGYGPYMQSLLSAIVSSSSEKAQVSSVVNIRIFGKKIEVPWVQSKKQLIKHNGKILTHLSMVGGFTNFARTFYDRFNGDKKAMEKFLASEEVKVFDDNLLRGVDLDRLELDAIELLKKLKSLKVDNQTLLNKFTNYLNSLGYEELRLVEDTLFKGLFLTSFIGTNKYHFPDQEKISKKFEKYKGLNLGFLFTLANSASDFWPGFYKFIPSSFNTINFWKPLNNVLTFLKMELMGEKNPDKNIAYKVLNDSLLIIKTLIFDRKPSERKDFMATLSNNSVLHKNFSTYLLSSKELLSDLMKNEADGLRSWVNFSEMIRNDERVTLKGYQHYFRLISSKTICDSGSCQKNPHFDEFYKLGIVFTSEKQYLNRMLDYLLRDEFDKILEYIKRTFSHIELFPKKPLIQ